MMDKDKVKKLISDLIVLYNYVINSGECRHEFMEELFQNGLGHVLLCLEDAGYITEKELVKYEFSMNL